MPIRALIVLLIVLNLGVAAWWITRPEAPPAPLPQQPEGVPRLRLLSESGVRAVAEAAALEAVVPTPAAPSVAADATSPPPAGPLQCHSLGPFVDAAAAGTAASSIGGQALRKRPREVPGKGASGYNVFLPPSTDRAAAQALAQRIGAAGFDDYLVINSGDQVNGIALGRYRSREGAERRQSALAAAGFAAQLQAIGQEGASQWWLDVEASGDVTGPQLKALAASAQSRSLDCATLR